MKKFFTFLLIVFSTLFLFACENTKEEIVVLNTEVLNLAKATNQTATSVLNENKESTIKLSVPIDISYEINNGENIDPDSSIPENLKLKGTILGAANIYLRLDNYETFLIYLELDLKFSSVTLLENSEINVEMNFKGKGYFNKNGLFIEVIQNGNLGKNVFKYHLMKDFSRDDYIDLKDTIQITQEDCETAINYLKENGDLKLYETKNKGELFVEAFIRNIHITELLNEINPEILGYLQLNYDNEIKISATIKDTIKKISADIKLGATIKEVKNHSLSGSFMIKSSITPRLNAKMPKIDLEYLKSFDDITQYEDKYGDNPKIDQLLEDLFINYIFLMFKMRIH